MQLRKTFFRSLLTLPFLFGGMAQVHAFTITPNITADPAIGDDTNNCSLRYAIESINNGVLEAGCADFATGTPGNNDTVILGADTYVLTLSGNNSGNATGDLDVIASEITLIGAGPDATTIDASGIPDKDRVLEFTNVNTANISGITFTGGDVSELLQYGGAIYSNGGGTITLTDILVTQNRAQSGGGIAIDSQSSTLIIRNSTIDTNFGSIDPQGGCGGGLSLFSESTVSIENSTISNNQSQNGNGGGICDSSEFLFLTNSTVSTNTASGSGGGISSSGGLKGTYNVTVAFNSAGEDGGGINRYTPPFTPDSRFDTQIYNTIIAKNTAAEDGNDCSGTFGSGGFNLIGDIGATDVCNTFVDGTNGDQVGTTAAPIDPLLGPLQFNGGSTSGETHALLTGSPAIDRANGFGCQALNVQDFIDNNPAGLDFVTLTTDQRLLTRPVAILNPDQAICDIGAFELQTFSFVLTKDDGLNGTIPAGETFTYTIAGTNNGSSDAIGVTLNDPLPSQVDFVSSTSSQGSCTEAADVVTCNLGNVAIGDSFTVTITVSAETAGTAVNTATLTVPPQNTLQASVTTVIVGGIGQFEGSGLHCALNRSIQAPGGSLSGLLALALISGLMFVGLRRKA